jgi:hypothetical protein
MPPAPSHIVEPRCRAPNAAYAASIVAFKVSSWIATFMVSRCFYCCQSAQPYRRGCNEFYFAAETDVDPHNDLDVHLASNHENPDSPIVVYSQLTRSLSSKHKSIGLLVVGILV